MEIDTPTTPSTAIVPVTPADNSNELLMSEEQPNKRRRKKSIVWEHFTIETVGAGCMRACCKQCKKSFAYITGSKLAGTSHLKRHIALGICPVSRQKNGTPTYTPGSKSDPPKKRFRAASGFSGIPFDQDRCSHEIAKMIIQHEYPLHIVEHPAFIDFVRTLQPLYNMVSFDTIQGECVAVYLREKQNLFNLISGIPGRVSLTLDLGTSNMNIGYAFLTGHFIDGDWNLHRRILNVVMLPFPDSDYAFNQAVVSCLSDWHLESRLFTLTLDQSFSNETILGNLRGLLSVRNPFVLNGQLLKGNCYARVLSRLAQDALGAMGQVVRRIRESVKYVKTSEAHDEKFTELRQQLQVPSTKDLIIDDQAKWNTTYEMLVAASELKEVFACLDTSDPFYKINPSIDDWKQVEILCGYLKLFFDAASILTGQSYPPAYAFYHEVSKIQLELTHASMSQDPFISNLTRPLKEKFDQYWKECFLVLAIAVVMDPRFKMKLVEFSFSKIFGEEAGMWIKIVDDGVHELFLEYLAPISLPAPFVEGDMGIPQSETPQNGASVPPHEEHLQVVHPESVPSQMHHHEVYAQDMHSQEVASGEVASQEMHSHEMPSHEVPPLMQAQKMPPQPMSPQEVHTDEVPPREVRSAEVSSREVQATDAPPQGVLTEASSFQEVQAGEVPSQEVQAGKAHSQEVQAEEPPSQEVQTEEAPTQEVQTEEAPSQEMLAERSPAQEVQTEEVPPQEMHDELPPQQAQTDEVAPEGMQTDEVSPPETQTNEVPPTEVQTDEVTSVQMNTQEVHPQPQKSNTEEVPFQEEPSKEMYAEEVPSHDMHMVQAHSKPGSQAPCQETQSEVVPSHEEPPQEMHIGEEQSQEMHAMQTDAVPPSEEMHGMQTDTLPPSQEAHTDEVISQHGPVQNVRDEEVPSQGVYHLGMQSEAIPPQHEETQEAPAYQLHAQEPLSREIQSQEVKVEVFNQEMQQHELHPQDIPLLSIGDGLSDFDVYISEITNSQHMKSELDQYLEESLLPRVQEFDVLGWWKLNKLKYPTLSKMAADILSIPLSTVAPDSVFDTQSKKIDGYRSSLRPVTLEALMCAKDWLQYGSSSSSLLSVDMSNALVKTEY